MKQCKRCGKEFEPRHSASKYCDQCLSLGRDVLSGKRFDPEKQQICEWCGCKYTRNRKTKYCSNECMMEYCKRSRKIKTADVNYKSPSKKYKHTCPICGKEYIGSTSKTKSCKECRFDMILDTKRNQIIKKKCVWCGREFQINGVSARQRFCSKTCNDAYNSKRRRARVRNAKIRPVYFHDIYKRDNGICQICHKQVYLNRGRYHPLSATLDHIIPLAKGGAHEPKNIQLAHRICNMKKGTKCNLDGSSYANTIKAI